MRHWLMKSEPDTFGIDDLMRRPRQTEHWDGVRNYQARNMIRDEMQKGDQAFFYHSSCDEPAIVGIVDIVRDAYPDSTALDPESPYFDPKSTSDAPRWYMVDVRFRRKLRRPLTLAELKQQPALAGLPLLRQGNRLSILPISAEEWKFILSLE